VSSLARFTGGEATSELRLGPMSSVLVGVSQSVGLAIALELVRGRRGQVRFGRDRC